MTTTYAPGDVAPDAETATCPVCERIDPADTHACRFELACSCWRGKPCQHAYRRVDDPDPRAMPTA